MKMMRRVGCMNMGRGIMRLGFVGLPSVLLRGVSVDPIAEDYPQYTSYNYAGNKPVSKVDLEGLQESDAPQKIEPKGGEIQLPDAQPGIATFELKVFDVVSDLPERSSNDTYSILGIGIETNDRDNIPKPDQLFQPMTDRERNQEFYNDIIRYGNGKLINTIMGMDYSQEFKSKLYKDWLSYSGSRFHDHPMGRLFTEFVLGFAAGGALEALAGGSNVLTSSRSYRELYRFEKVTIPSGNAATTGGRLGNAATRSQIDDIATVLESREYSISGGGQRTAEENLRPLGGGRLGGSYPDITATYNNYSTLRINTVDVLKDGITPTARELRNAERIRSQISPGEHLILIPKR